MTNPATFARAVLIRAADRCLRGALFLRAIEDAYAARVSRGTPGTPAASPTSDVPPPPPSSRPELWERS